MFGQNFTINPLWSIQPPDSMRSSINDVTLNPKTGNVIIVSYPNNDSTAIIPYILNSSSGDTIGVLKTDGITKGELERCYGICPEYVQIKASASGQIFTTNTGNSGVTKIYRWADETAIPELIYTDSLGTDITNLTGISYGRNLGVYGRSDSLTLILPYVYSSGTNPMNEIVSTRIRVIKWDGTVVSNAYDLLDLHGKEYFSMSASAIDERVLMTFRGNWPIKFNYNNVNDTTTYQNSDYSLLTYSSYGVEQIALPNENYFIFGPLEPNNSYLTFQESSSTVVGIHEISDFEYRPEAGSIVHDTNSNSIFVLNAFLGLSAFTMADFELSNEMTIHENGITILCNDAPLGAQYEINGVIYTRRTEEQITTENASTTCTSGITDFSSLFLNDTAFNEDISHWDVSSAKWMHTMFRNAKSFNQDISSWDVSNVIDMGMMFYSSKSFNQDISSWDVSSVMNSSYMFSDASSFNQPLNNWVFAQGNDSTYIQMESMFWLATSFNQPLNNWDVSNVTNMKSMFSGSSSFNQPLNNWDVSNVTNMSNMFSGASSFNQPLNNWDVSNVTDISRMFRSASSFNQNLSSFKLYKIAYSRNFLTNTDIENKYYTEMLVNWASDDSTIVFIELDISTSYNQDAIESRQKLIDDFKWTITDAGLDFYPDSLKLISPTQNEIGVKTIPTLVWECTAGGEQSSCYSHQVQVSDSITFTNILVDTSGTFNENVDNFSFSFVLDTTLNFETTYYWRVKSSNNVGTSDWSNISSFTTGKQLEVENLKLVDEESLNVISHNPSFSYNYVSGDSSIQKSYQFQVTTNNSFETTTYWDSGFIETDSTVFSYSGDSLLDGATYYSRLRITTDSDTSSWKEFTFRMNSTPSIPVLASPSNNYLFKLDDEISLQVNEVADAE